MSWLVYAVATIAILAAVYLVARAIVRVRRLREPMLVECPETGETAAVKLDPGPAAKMATAMPA